MLAEPLFQYEIYSRYMFRVLCKILVYFYSKYVIALLALKYLCDSPLQDNSESF